MVTRHRIILGDAEPGGVLREQRQVGLRRPLGHAGRQQTQFLGAENVMQRDKLPAVLPGLSSRRDVGEIGRWSGSLGLDQAPAGVASAQRTSDVTLKLVEGLH